MALLSKTSNFIWDFTQLFVPVLTNMCPIVVNDTCHGMAEVLGIETNVNHNEVTYANTYYDDGICARWSLLRMAPSDKPKMTSGGTEQRILRPSVRRQS